MIGTTREKSKALGTTTFVCLIMGLLVMQAENGWADIAFGPMEYLVTSSGEGAAIGGNAQLAGDGLGNWVAVWRIGGLNGSDFDIYCSYSNDNGSTWSFPFPLNTNADTDMGRDESPQVTTDRLGTWIAIWRTSNMGPTGSLFDSEIYISRSTDNGKTWNSPIRFNINDDETASKANGGPQLTTDGQGNWSACWQSAEYVDGYIPNLPRPDDYDIFFRRSSDNGLTWSAPTKLNNNSDFESFNCGLAQITTDRLGKWIAIWTNLIPGPGAVTYISHSFDNGASWSTPAPLHENIIFTQLATDEMGNWMAVGLGPTVLSSTDNGVTWGVPTLLNTEAFLEVNNTYAPQITADQWGNWVVVWHSVQTSASGNGWSDLDIYVSHSSDVGITWSVPYTLNMDGSEPDNRIDDRDPQIATDGLGKWIAIWNVSSDIVISVGEVIDPLGIDSWLLFE